MLKILPFVIAISVGTAYAQEYKYHEEYYGEEYAGEVTDAYTQGKTDAEAEVNGTLWFAAGFFLGIWGILAAYLIEPTPSATTLIGKDPEWIQLYTAAYKKAGRDKQVRMATIGCIVSGIAYAAFYCCYIYYIAASATTYAY